MTIPAGFCGTVTVKAAAEDPEGIYAPAEAEAVITVNRITNKITTSAASYTKTASTSAQSFTLGTKVKGTGKVTYKSSSSSVKVSSSGKVTIAKNYVGKATITISVAQKGIYNAASKKVTVTVKPAKTVISQVTNSAANKVTVKWKKPAGVGGYQIQYSVKSDFSTAGKLTITSGSTLSRVISSLVKNKKYYIRIRAYKKVSGTNYYGAWSAVKSVTIKKGKTIYFEGTPKISRLDVVDGDVDAFRVNYKAVTGADGYQIYYQVEQNSKLSAWKLAGKTTGNSLEVKVKHGKNIFYFFRMRAYKKRADGTVIYSRYSAETDGTALYYNPDFATFMLSDAKSSTNFVLIRITNNGKFNLRVYSSRAKLLDHDYDSYDRDLQLIDSDLNAISYVDIPAGEAVLVSFMVKSGGPTWYDKKTDIRYRFRYDGGMYYAYSSAYYGTNYYAE